MKFPLHLSVVINQPTVFQNETGPSIQCEYSSTWFSNLSPHFLKICREKVSANDEDAHM